MIEYIKSLFTAKPKFYFISFLQIEDSGDSRVHNVGNIVVSCGTGLFNYFDINRTLESMYGGKCVIISALQISKKEFDMTPERLDYEELIQ